MTSLRTRSARACGNVRPRRWASRALVRDTRRLDAAALAVDARWSSGMMDGKNPQAIRARARLVERRQAITSVPPAPRISEAPRDKEPHKSHDSMRVLFGTGMTSQYDTGFATLGYRLVLHDLADPPDGEPELLQLQFLDTRLRYDYGRQLLTVDSVTFAELMALKPLTRFAKEPSWRVRAFGARLHDRGAPDVFGHGLDASIGGTLATENQHAAIFLMADTYVQFFGSARRDRRHLRAGRRRAVRRHSRALPSLR